MARASPRQSKPGPILALVAGVRIVSIWSLSLLFSAVSAALLLCQAAQEAAKIGHSFFRGNAVRKAHLPSPKLRKRRGRTDTGALRKAVQNRLKKLSYIAEFHSGEYGEGDTGVTIATFR
ncbi:MAG: Smr/MutS family protein [Lachnospiraceae bacterium]|nr:Smr/MutS family protein [Lachnospiraceae bacterium]